MWEVGYEGYSPQKDISVIATFIVGGSFEKVYEAVEDYLTKDIHHNRNGGDWKPKNMTEALDLHFGRVLSIDWVPSKQQRLYGDPQYFGQVRFMGQRNIT